MGIYRPFLDKKDVYIKFFFKFRNINIHSIILFSTEYNDILANYILIKCSLIFVFLKNKNNNPMDLNYL